MRGLQGSFLGFISCTLTCLPQVSAADVLPGFLYLPWLNACCLLVWSRGLERLWINKQCHNGYHWSQWHEVSQWIRSVQAGRYCKTGRECHNGYTVSGVLLDRSVFIFVRRWTLHLSELFCVYCLQNLSLFACHDINILYLRIFKKSIEIVVAAFLKIVWSIMQGWMLLMIHIKRFQTDKNSWLWSSAVKNTWQLLW